MSQIPMQCVCDLKIKCDHMGRHDVVKHTTGKRHQDRARSLQSLNFSGLGSSEIMKRTEAELKLAVLTASGNVPMHSMTPFLLLSEAFFPILR